jgi:hypothetical protein
MPPPEKLGPPVDAEEARKAFAAEEVPAFLPLPDGFAGAAAELDGRGRTGMKRESGGNEMYGSWAGTTRDKFGKRSDDGSSFFFGLSLPASAVFASDFPASPAGFSSCSPLLNASKATGTHHIHGVRLVLLLGLVARRRFRRRGQDGRLDLFNLLFCRGLGLGLVGVQRRLGVADDLEFRYLRASSDCTRATAKATHPQLRVDADHWCRGEREGSAMRKREPIPELGEEGEANNGRHVDAARLALH